MRLNKVFTLPIYGCEVRFIVAPDLEKEVKKIAKKKEYEITMTEGAGALAFSLFYYEYYILVTDHFLTHSYISHEIFHTVEAIAKGRGIKDEETRAYLCGHLTGRIYKYLAQRKIKINLD